MTSFGMSDVRAAVEEMAGSVEAFKARYEERYRALENQVTNQRKATEEVEEKMDDLELKMGRSAIMGGGGYSGPGGLPGSKSSAHALDAERKAFGCYIRNGDESELKAMSVGSDPDGGYVVQSAMSASMTKKLFDQSPMRRLARVETITAGDAWEEPIDNDDVQAEWVGELESRPETDTAEIGMLRVPVHEMYVNYPISQRLMEDANRDVGAWAEDKISDRFGRKEGESFTSGNGILKPRGFLAYPTAATADASRAWGTLQHVNSGAASTVTADGLKDTYWALRAPYRANAVWLMASETANLVDKLKNGQGDYIWRDSSAAGVPPTLLGRPVEFDENMPAVAAGTFPIAFGDWNRGYVIVQKNIMSMLRDPFTAKPKVLLYARRRVGGAVANSEAIKLQYVSA